MTLYQPRDIGKVVNHGESKEETRVWSTASTVPMNLLIPSRRTPFSGTLCAGESTADPILGA